MSKLHVKKGDKVLFLINDVDKKKGESEIGRVLSTNPDKGTVIVENVNLQKKHKKAKSAKESGGIVTQSGPVNVSNIMVICPACDKPTRVSKKNVEDKNVRVCKKCGAVMDVKVKRGAAKAAEKKAKAAKGDDGEVKTTAKKPKAPKTDVAAKSETPVEKIETAEESTAPVKKAAAKKESAPKAPKVEEKAE